MKKLMISILFASVLLLCLTSCSTEQGQGNEETTTEPVQSDETTSEPEKEEYQWVIDEIDLSANMYEIIVEAQSKGFVMLYNGKVLMGEEKLFEFYEKHQNGQEASLQYCSYSPSYDQFTLRELYYDTEKIHVKMISQGSTIIYNTYNFFKYEENIDSPTVGIPAVFFLTNLENASFFHGSSSDREIICIVGGPVEEDNSNTPINPEHIEWEIDQFELSENSDNNIARAKANGYFVSDYICTEVSGYEKVTDFFEKYQSGQEARLKILQYATDVGPIYLTELYYDTEYIYYKKIEQGGIIKWYVYKFVYFEEEDFTTAKITWLFLTNIEGETHWTHVANMASSSHRYCTAKQIQVKYESNQ